MTELIIVIVIIGILASIAIPRFFGAIRMARESEAECILRSIRSAQLKYYLDWDAYTATIGDLDFDLTANPTDYYTYSAVTAPGAGDDKCIGQAEAIGGLTNYRIQVDGDIVPY